MAVVPHPGDLERALDLILQPLLVETLTAIGDGEALEDALPVGTDTVLLVAALDRLAAIRAVEPSTGPLLGHYMITQRGERLLQLIDALDAALAQTEKVAG